jgi:hypothetical protein
MYTDNDSSSEHFGAGDLERCLRGETGPNSGFSLLNMVLNIRADFGLFITGDGHMGLGAKIARPDDVVCREGA